MFTVFYYLWKPLPLIAVIILIPYLFTYIFPEETEAKIRKWNRRIIIAFLAVAVPYLAVRISVGNAPWFKARQAEVIARNELRIEQRNRIRADRQASFRKQVDSLKTVYQKEEQP